MFLNGICEFESKFKLFDRLNILVFNVWRDKNALAYRDSDIARITDEYRRYISKVRSLSDETYRLERELENKSQEIENINRKIADISLNPEIKGCNIHEAWGANDFMDEDGNLREQKSDTIRFIAKGDGRDKARELIGNAYETIHVSGCSQSL